MNSNENTREIENEEKFRFVRSIMDSLGIDVGSICDESGNISIENKLKFRQIISVYNIEIIGEPGGDLRVYHENDNLIGEWRKPKYILKKDNSQKDPKKRLYLEMHLSYFSIFDENEKT